jgi:hypothetical protein
MKIRKECIRKIFIYSSLDLDISIVEKLSGSLCRIPVRDFRNQLRSVKSKHGLSAALVTALVTLMWIFAVQILSCKLSFFYFLFI